MAVYLVVLLSLLNSISQRGSKVAVSLYALELGAGSLLVGVLAALFAAFPLLLAVHAGRVSDRFGMRAPIFAGCVVMALGLLLPVLDGSVAMLIACATLTGLGHIYFHVTIHNLVGALGEEQRTKNFATFSLGSSIAAFIGPSAAGFGIEKIGYGVTFAMLACFAALPALLVLIVQIPSPAPHAYEGQKRNAWDLLDNRPLRRTLIMSGVTLTGIELFSFYLPIYGRAIGLAPSSIGMILSTYAVAGFLVRVFMHRLAQRFGEIGMLTGSLFLAAMAYAAVPALHDGVLLAAAAFALGLALGTAQPLTIILTYNHAPKGRSGEALGMRIMANKVTQIGMPLLFGGVGAALGSVPVFLATGTFLFAGGVLSLLSSRGESE
jgi:MFS family permease